MAISYVGGVAGGRAGATSTTTQSISGTLTGGSNSSPSPGDIVVVWCSAGADTTAAPNQTVSGNNNGTYSTETQQSQLGTTYDAYAQLNWKVQGSTVDTTITIPSSGSTRNAQRWAIHVFRGVNSTTPWDVTSTTASGTASGRPNPPSITPSSTGAWILWLGHSAAATGTAYTAPTDFATNWRGGTTADTADCMDGFGYYTGWTSGAYDPAAITAGGTTNSADAWVAKTAVLKPSANAYTLTANGGSYSVTGGNAVLTKSKLVTASAGSYAVTGNNATLTWAPAAVAYTLTAQAGSYSLTGGSAVLSKNKSLTAEAGSYAVTGNSATLLKSKVLVANSGSYAVTGNSAALNKNRTLTTTAGSYTLTGNDSTLLKSKLIIASTGTYSVTGNSADLTYTPAPGAYVLTALAGSYSVTGNTASLLKSKLLTVEAGSYSLTGAASNLYKTKLITAEQGSYSVTGNSAILTYVATPGVYTLTCLSGDYAVVGNSANLTYSSISHASRQHKQVKDKYHSITWNTDWQKPIVGQVEKVLTEKVVEPIKDDTALQPPSKYLEQLERQLELYVQQLEDSISSLQDAQKRVRDMNRFGKMIAKLNKLAEEQRKKEIVIAKQKQEQEEFEEVQMLVSIYNSYFNY